MKQKEVGYGVKIVEGQEIYYKLYCCDVVIDEINLLRELREYLKKINRIINPPRYIEVCDTGMKYNFCPICGNKLKGNK